jgi:flagellar hook protein FlgE
MQRSLFTAVSGLRNHQIKMDVIGNNIANVNTTAFKAGRVRFQDILSQNIRGASAPQFGRGGINPAQVGLGMSIAAIDTIHEPGSLQNTGRPTDLAIQGAGFFIVTDGVSYYYTRDGAFSRGADGDLVNSANGLKLLGWTVDSSGAIDTNAPLGTLNIPLGQKVTTKPTEEVLLGANLDASADTGALSAHETAVYVYDSQGGIHTVRIAFEKTGTNQWTWEAERVLPDGTIVSPDAGTGSGTLEFDVYGNLETSTGDTTAFAMTGVDNLSIAMDFSGMTQVVGPSNALVRYQDGFPVGELAGFTIERSGVVSGIYTNGLVRELGQIALASFSNPEGLLKGAANMYQISTNSGLPFIGTAGQGNLGVIETATLEMSNVDLAYEFTEMITTTRAFQANSRVITSSDELLHEIVNLKR